MPAIVRFFRDSFVNSLYDSLLADTRKRYERIMNVHFRKFCKLGLIPSTAQRRRLSQSTKYVG